MSSRGGEGECGGGQPQKSAPLPKGYTVTQPSIMSRQGPMTRDEFLLTTERKFKSNLIKQAGVRRTDPLLLAFSGSASSRAMLHLVYNGINEEARRKLSFQVHVVYVDTGAVFNLSKEERENTTTAIREICSGYKGFQFHNCKLEDLFDNDETKLCKYINSFTTLSSKEDAFKQLVLQRIVLFAQEIKIKKVVVGDNATSVAIKIISDTCKGRGFSIPTQVHFSDNRFLSSHGVVLIHPMKTFLAKEVAFYVHYLKLKTVFIPTLHTFAPSKSSIETLTHDFIQGLQSQFPSTVHTVIRSVEKLKIPTVKNQIFCALCGSALPEHEIQQIVKSTKDLKLDEKSTESYKNFCCYGCKRMLEDRGDKSSAFPKYVGEAVKMSQKEMKEEIKEFLIEEN